MSNHKTDHRRRELARTVRRSSVEDFHDLLAEEGVNHAFLISENGEITLSHPRLLKPVKAFFELSQDFDDHEGVFIGREDGIPTLFFAFVHDTRRGLAQGGLRFNGYENLADILVDGLRLARGMTRKNALAGLWWGGGKGIVAITESIRTPEYLTEGTEKRLELFRAYGRFIASLGGIYYTAEDVGTKTSDMNAILGQNRFTTCVGGELGGSGNPSPATARGVFVAMQAAWRFLTGTDDLAGAGVAVQGVGNVGGPLVALLDDAGAQVWVTDIDTRALEDLKRERPRIEIVENDVIFDLDVDVFAPCAIGAQINARTIPRLKVRLICGAANNILEEDADAERLRQRGIAYVPDYLCNRMGITNCADEWQGYLRRDVELAAERVYPDTLRVLKHARGQMITTATAADQLADIAACELHPMIGHRGRRIGDQLIASRWHRPRRRRTVASSAAGERAPVPAAFAPGADEPTLRVRWEREGRFRGEGTTLAAAPISAAARPGLAPFLSALLMDVRARALELENGRRPRRVVGSDPGGLALQLAVERSLPFEREEIGRPRFTERCADVHRGHDAAIREQLHQLGVGFDPDAWLDPMSQDGERAARRLFYALKDAGLITRERRLAYYDPTTETVLVSPDVIRTRIALRERYVVRFEVRGGRTGAKETIEAQTFYPELLPGAVAVAVRQDGPYGHLAGRAVHDPLRHDELPVYAYSDLATSAKFLVPAHDRDDEALARDRGIEERRVAIDGRGRLLLPSEPPLVREEARRRVIERLGSRIERIEGRFEVDAFRARRSGTLVNLGYSSQVFVHLDKAAARLRRAIEAGSVTFSDERWRDRALELTENPEPWCISRQYWWGHALPDARTPGGRLLDSSREDVLSVWFSLVASTLLAAGWPGDAEPEPIDELYVDHEILARWALPAQLVSLTLTGRPAFRHLHVHGALHLVERVLEERADAAEVPEDHHDEERFVVRWVRRPMRLGLGNAVEPAALIRRFGADALRLGYLLSLHSGSMQLATAAESNLRRARHTVHRLSGKVTGLFHLTHAEDSDTPPRLADAWILERASEAADGARRAYAGHRLGDAAKLLAEAVDDLARFAQIAASRRHDGRGLGSIRSTVTAVVERLAAGFSPVCPYLFEKLVAWTAARAPARAEAPGWVGELVEQVAAGSGTVEIGSSDPQVLAALNDDREEIEALTGTRITIAEDLEQGVEIGPCMIARRKIGKLRSVASSKASLR
ncbi:MAG: class I tRNA ligase family protein [bacterium]|nr:class I tRNA ligase family protein [bacterium]